MVHTQGENVQNNFKRVFDFTREDGLSSREVGCYRSHSPPIIFIMSKVGMMSASIPPLRMEEIKQSLKIIKQAMKDMPDGPINVANPYMRAPAKPDVYSRMEEMIAHFKMVIDGLKPPVGEVYFPTEAANGELGWPR